MDLSAPVRFLASLRSESAELLSILQKVEVRYNQHIQLMIFNDFLVLLLILCRWDHSNLWPDPGDVVHWHFDVTFPPTQKL